MEKTTKIVTKNTNRKNYKILTIEKNPISVKTSRHEAHTVQKLPVILEISAFENFVVEQNDENPGWGEYLYEIETHLIFAFIFLFTFYYLCSVIFTHEVHEEYLIRVQR